MKKLCSEGIEVRYAMKMETAIFEDGKVKAKFTNGEVVEGDLLIGCDGSRSAVREVLLGAEKAKRTLCGLRLTTSIVKYADPEVARKVRTHPQMFLGHHSDGIFNLISSEARFRILPRIELTSKGIVCNVPDSNDPTSWEFYLVMSVFGESSEGHDDATLLAHWKSYGEKLADPFRTAVMEIPETTPLFNDRLYYWTPIPWDNHDGRITLAGDAAHPMPPCEYSSVKYNFTEC